MMQRRTGKALEQAGASFKFGPAEGPDFFAPNGWKPVQIESLLHTATRFRRPPLLLRFFAKISDAHTWQIKRPWAGVCLLQKNSIPNIEQKTTT
jgi:hypothetical protein